MKNMGKIQLLSFLTKHQSQRKFRLGIKSDQMNPNYLNLIAKMILRIK